MALISYRMKAFFFLDLVCVISVLVASGAFRFTARRISLLTVGWRVQTEEGLYCKRPIQCLASSEILTPHPLTARRVCTPAFVAGGGHTRWRLVEKTPDTALYSIYLSTLWFKPSDSGRNIEIVG